MLKKAVHIRCAADSILDAHFAQTILTKHNRFDSRGVIVQSRTA